MRESEKKREKFIQRKRDWKRCRERKKERDRKGEREIERKGERYTDVDIETRKEAEKVKDHGLSFL